MKKRLIVCLSFDHDNTSLFIANGRTSPSMTSRGDFGSVALPRVLGLLDYYNIRATFFTPGHTLESYPEDAELLLRAGHEIGHHGWSHRAPASLGREAEAEELVRGRETIRSLTGADPAGYRSPAWELSPHSVELLLEQGFTYDSSMMGHDYDAYFARLPDHFPLDAPVTHGASTGLIEMPVSWSLDDFPHFEFMATGDRILPGLAASSAVLENFTEDFLYMKEICEWGIMTYTFHPFVIGRGHRMRMLERLIQRLIREGAVFMTMADAAQEWLTQRQ